MGMKKECSCGYWNKEQEECLYNGHGCAKDKSELTEKWIEEKARKIVEEIGYRVEGEFLKVHIDRAKDFIHLLVEEINRVA